MKKGNIYTLPYRRKREGKTDYRRRLKLLLSQKCRLVVRKSLSNITAQAATYSDKGDIIRASADSKSLKAFGWKGSLGSTPAAYLVGMLLGNLSRKEGINEMVLDIGRNRPIQGSRIYAVLKGVLDSGVKVPHSIEVLPKEERIMGKHISSYASAGTKKDKNAFTEINKKGIDLSKLAEHVKETRDKIMEASK